MIVDFDLPTITISKSLKSNAKCWLKDPSLSEAWSKIPEKLAFYDYIGNNSVKRDHSEFNFLILEKCLVDYMLLE